jgi:glycosyltransferase involved in cell wall biosynthesis
MKILLISGIFPPDIGGPATYIPQLANELSDYYHDVTVITLGEIKNNYKSKYKVIYISRNQPKILRIIKTIATIYREINNDNHIFANGLHQETAIALKLKSKNRSVAKIVGDPVWERAINTQRTILKINDFNKIKLNGKNRLERVLIKWSLNQFSAVTCPSEELCSFVKNWGVTTRTIFIPNGVKIPETIQISKRYDVLTVSRLVPWKNIDKILLAIAGTNFSLAIVGDGPEDKRLRSLASDLKINVTFLGRLNEDETHEAMVNSKIFILLSNYEGLSFSLIQAMANGLTPIVSNVTGNTAVVKNGINGIVEEIENIPKITNAINKLLTDSDYYKRISLEAKLTATEEYNLDSNLKKITSLIKQN